MLCLDFSLSEFDPKSIITKSNFEQSVKDFLIEWFSESHCITVHTSGSTGDPKEIILTKENMRKSASMTAKYLQLSKGNTALLAMPVTYIAGKLMIIRSIEIGLKLICIEPSSNISFHIINQDLKESLSAIDFVALTPMQVEKSIAFVQNCRKLIIGGAPLSEKVKNELFKMNNEVYETYGMTETITHIALKKIRNKKFMNVENLFEVFDEIKISQDERDCLVIETPYDNLKIVTNDIVEIINKKKFNWIARIDNVVNSGGIKLFPEKVEEKLKPFIDTDFYLTSKKDEILGEKLILVIEGKSRDIDFSIMNLNKYQIPKEILFIEKFQRTESGKIKRIKVK